VYFKDTSDWPAQSELVGIIRDGSQDVNVRIAAYEGLFLVRGVALELSPMVAIRQLEGKEFRFPDDIDWRFVEDCAAGR
jgi:hypothetical protein